MSSRWIEARLCCCAAVACSVASCHWHLAWQAEGSFSLPRLGQMGAALITQCHSDGGLLLVLVTHSFTQSCPTLHYAAATATVAGRWTYCASQQQ